MAERTHVAGSLERPSQRHVRVPEYWFTVGLDPATHDLNGLSQVTHAFQLYQEGYDEETAIMMARRQL